MSRQVNLGQIVPNIQIGETTTVSPGTPASVVNTGTSLNPILNFTIPRGDPGAIKFEIVAELPTENIKEDTIYLVPITPDTQGNNYAEYIYVNGAWELLGKIGVQIDLTNYVQFTDYANQNTGGVIKTNTNFGTTMTGSGQLYPVAKTYEQYNSGDHRLFIGKDTLENVITGKGLVSNTDYASASTGGVIKATIGNQLQVNASGELTSRTVAYSSYGNILPDAFISKGTLENAITGKGLVSNTDYASSSVGGVVKIGNGFSLYSTGTPYASIFDYTTYQSTGNDRFISKGTLENVLTARIGDIQTLLDNLNNGGGVE